MKFSLITILLLVGCATKQIHNIGLVHNYIFYNAVKMCANHGGLHYIVTDVSMADDNTSNPCDEKIKIRCQDQVLLDFNSGVKYCFIQRMQLEETLGDKK